jgi:hypothetical protein
VAVLGSGVNPFEVKDYTKSASFIAFCIEPMIGISTDTTHPGAGASYNSGVTTESYTGSTYTNAQVQYLYDLYYQGVLDTLNTSITPLAPIAPVATALANKGVHALEAAAFQFALWDLLHDVGSNNISTGAFALNDLVAAPTPSNSAIARGNQMLTTVSSLVGAPIKKFKLTKWDSAHSQDLMQASAVPEPSAYALIAAGLGVVAFSQRRRLLSKA